MRSVDNAHYIVHNIAERQLTEAWTHLMGRDKMSIRVYMSVAALCDFVVQLSLLLFSIYLFMKYILRTILSIVWNIIAFLHSFRICSIVFVSVCVCADNLACM